MGESQETENEGVAGKVRKPYRHKPGTVALQNIKKLQRAIGWQLPHAVFKRMVRQVLYEEGMYHLRFERMAIKSLHDILEARVIERFRTAQNLAVHRGNKSIRMPDFKLAGDYQRVHRLSSEMEKYED